MRKVDFTGSVSWGTLREEDLIHRFTEVLEEYAPERARSLIKEYELVYLALEDGTFEKLRSEDYIVDLAYALLNDLFDALDELAPDGYYFGAHPGNGSDFGFWPVEEGDCGGE